MALDQDGNSRQLGTPTSWRPPATRLTNHKELLQAPVSTAENIAKRTKHALLPYRYINGCQIDPVPERIEPCLHGVDIALDTRQLSLDSQNIRDSIGTFQQVSEPVTQGKHVFQPGFYVNILCSDILR